MQANFVTIMMAGALVTAWTPASASSDAIAAYATAAAETLPDPVRQVLQSVKGEPRKMLATRAYLRADKALLSRWSWSEQQIADYQASVEYKALLNAVAAVNDRFAARNPGYSLFVNTQVRSLDLQLQRWNENPGVGQAAERIYVVVGDELRNGEYPAVPDSAATRRFVVFLKDLPPAIPVPLAAPGLSLHGQSRALDFQVRKGARTVAGPEVASVAGVWEKQGWARKLHEAVDPARGVFVGPLRSPNEPWHYEYVK